MMANKISREHKKSISNIVWNFFCILLCCVFVFPFIYMVFNSLASDDSQIFVMEPSVIPAQLRFQNYIDAFKQMKFLRSLGNTLIIMIPVIILNMFGSLLAAYGFARCKGKYKNLLFVILIGTMMLPWVVTMVPAFVVFKKIGWIGTMLPLIVPAFGGSAYNIFMMRQFIMSLPRELDDAATLDGCNALQTLFLILVPNMKPILMTLFVFLFTAMWSDYIGPSLYLLYDEQETLSLALLSFQDSYSVSWNLTLAGSVMFSLPMIIVLFAAQKSYIGNAMDSAIK